MNITVIVCCYNSENRIVPTLEHLSKQNFENLKCEIILVDNNCTDNTVDIALQAWESFGNPFQLHIVRETEPGLSFARRCGVFAAQGEILVFCDDDNWLKNDFLTIGYSIMKSNQSIGVLGGQGKPVFQSVTPTWFSTFQGSYAVGYQSLYSGDISSRGYVWGAGCFLRRNTLVTLFQTGFENFCTDRKGLNLSSGGDSEICKWHLLIGQKLWFDENLVFEHYIETNRLNKIYLEGLQRGFQLSDQILNRYSGLIFFFQMSIIEKCRKLTILFFQSTLGRLSFRITFSYFLIFLKLNVFKSCNTLEMNVYNCLMKFNQLKLNEKTIIDDGAREPG